MTPYIVLLKLNLPQFERDSLERVLATLFQRARLKLVTSGTMRTANFTIKACKRKKIVPRVNIERLKLYSSLVCLSINTSQANTWLVRRDR